MSDKPGSDPHGSPKKSPSIARRIIFLVLLVLAFLGLYKHGGEILHHVADAASAVMSGDFAKVPEALGDLFPIAGAAWISHAFDFYEHLIKAALGAHADIASVLAHGGMAKVVLGLGVGLMWAGAFALLGFTYMPIIAACTTWAGKAAWTAAYVGMLAGCYEVSCIWKRWRAPPQGG